MLPWRGAGAAASPPRRWRWRRLNDDLRIFCLCDLLLWWRVRIGIIPLRLLRCVLQCKQLLCIFEVRIVCDHSVRLCKSLHAKPRELRGRREIALTPGEWCGLRLLHQRRTTRTQALRMRLDQLRCGRFNYSNFFLKT